MQLNQFQQQQLPQMQQPQLQQQPRLPVYPQQLTQPQPQDILQRLYSMLEIQQNTINDMYSKIDALYNNQQVQQPQQPIVEDTQNIYTYIGILTAKIEELEKSNEQLRNDLDSFEPNKVDLNELIETIIERNGKSINIKKLK